MSTPDIRLRPVEEVDLEALYLQQAEPGWAEMVGMPSRGRDEYVAHMRRVLSDPVNIARTIVVDGEVAGSIGTFPVGDGREVGYSLASAFWGRGIATRALELMLAEDRHRPLQAGVDPGNAGSRRVLEKCGFVHVGHDGSDGVDLYELR